MTLPAANHATRTGLGSSSTCCSTSTFGRGRGVHCGGLSHRTRANIDVTKPNSVNACAEARRHEEDLVKDRKSHVRAAALPGGTTLFATWTVVLHVSDLLVLGQYLPVSKNIIIPATQIHPNRQALPTANASRYLGLYASRILVCSPLWLIGRSRNQRSHGARGRVATVAQASPCRPDLSNAV